MLQWQLCIPTHINHVRHEEILKNTNKNPNSLCSDMISCIHFHHKGHESVIELVIVTLITWLSSYRILFLTTAQQSL